MAVAEENWQTKRPTIAERTTFIFNNELLSDVKFVVPVSTGESESKKAIPAHKFVLAISSPVFFAMLYGQMAETTDSIELPDCDYESLLELFRYMYSDEANLSGSNVMQVLYLANKYMVPSLAAKCTEYLRDNLDASNVFCILPQAQKLEDKDLEDRCWEVIELETEEAVTSDEFVTLERSLVEAVVKREALNVKEVELFKAVDRWATKEIERQGMTPDGVVKRQILGEEIVKAMRFPLMSQAEFLSVVFDSYILTMQEVGDIMKHYSGILASVLPFTQAARINPAASVYRCHRFEKFNPPDAHWNYSDNKNDSICFSVTSPIKLHGVQHFGSEGGEYTVQAEVKDTTDGSSMIKHSGVFSSVKQETDTYYSFDVLFDHPVCLEKGRKYNIDALISGPRSWYGGYIISGAGRKVKKAVECKGVYFTFTSSDSSPNGTYVTGGQFPAIIFSQL
ncbi:BTB/POZ domain-containing protein 6-like [Oculina patagonica]